MIFGAALFFFRYLVHLMSIGTILSNIYKYLDLPHRLRNFRVLARALTMAGMGDYTLGWTGRSGLCNFLKIRGLTPLSDAFCNADHDELIKIYTFYKKMGHRPAFVVKY